MITVKLRKHLHSHFGIKRLALMLIFSIFFVPQAVYAETKSENSIVTLNYIHGQTNKNENIEGAIQFTLSPGWKTYWRSPGPLGIRPIIDWSESENIQNIEFFWPTPKIFNQYGVQVIGYENVLIIPIQITKFISEEPAFLNLNLEFGVCSNICLLKTTQIKTLLKSQVPIENIDLISKALKTVPTNITDPVFSLSSCVIEKRNDDLVVTYTLQLSEFPKSQPTMIIEYKFSKNNLENQIIEIKGKNLIVTASLKNIYKDEGAIQRNRLNAILILEDKGFKISSCS